MNTKKIVMTGGHAGPTAYATIQALKKDKDIIWDVSWIGVKKAVEGKNVHTYEYQVFPKANVKFFGISAGRIQRKFTIHTVPSLLKIPVGFIQSLFILIKIHPSIVLSFGGYAGFPVVVSAWILGVPVIIHEQTIAVGRANKYSSYFAKRIAIAREESRKYFQKREVVLVGNPVLEEVRSIPAKNGKSSPPLIFVTGGTRGSEIINDTVFEIILKLVKKYKVIHQTGMTDLSKAEEIRKTLGEFKDNYTVKSFIHPNDWPNVLAKADVIISRAGANVTSEILIVKRPSILIPIPFSYLNEQLKNAEYVKEVGLAKIIEQSKLSGKILFGHIGNILENYQDILQKTKNFRNELDENAADKLAELVRENVR